MLNIYLSNMIKKSLKIPKR